jgi:hypothetical protein
MSGDMRADGVLPEVRWLPSAEIEQPTGTSDPSRHTMVSG